MTYKDKLTDPRWQRKRLEILQRDNFKCRSCNDDSVTLHVHHLNYESGLNPWEYDNTEMITLCKNCHDAWHKIFDLDIDPCTVLMIAKLWDKMESVKINKWLEQNG